MYTVVLEIMQTTVDMTELFKFLLNCPLDFLFMISKRLTTFDKMVTNDIAQKMFCNTWDYLLKIHLSQRIWLVININFLSVNIKYLEYVLTIIKYSYLSFFIYL